MSVLAFTAGFHSGFSWAVVLSNGVVGAWALGAHFRPQWWGRPLWVALVLAQLTIFVQVIAGVVYQNRNSIPDPGDLHRLYGFAAVAAVAILYAYQSQLAHSRQLLYAGGSLFLAGLGIRAMILT